MVGSDEKQRNSFVFYRGFRDSINECPAEEQLDIYKSIVDYALDGIEPDLQTSFGRVCWKLIKPILDKNLSRYRNGCKGGAPLGNTNKKGKKSTKNQPNINQNQPNDNVNVNDNVSSNEDILKENYKKKKTANSDPLSEKEQGFLDWMQENYPTVCRMKKPLTYQQFCKLREEYSEDRIKDILDSMENHTPLLKKYTSAVLTIKSWIKR